MTPFQIPKFCARNKRAVLIDMLWTGQNFDDALSMLLEMKHASVRPEH